MTRASARLESGGPGGYSFRMKTRDAKFAIGQVVRHRIFPFRGVIFDVDPEFANTEDWWNAIPPETRPRKDQPFYHLMAESEDASYIARTFCQTNPASRCAIRRSRRCSRRWMEAIA